MTPKRILILGATSGLGYHTARLFQRRGWTVGIAGRRADELEALRALAPERTHALPIDANTPEAPTRLLSLIEAMGGMDVYLHCAGIGKQNRSLNPEIELATLATNGTGFTRMVTAAYRYLAAHGGGQLAVISSIAGTKGLGAAPAYSATKRFQNTYIDALEQLAHKERHAITFTDIRPGFVRTALLGEKPYPLLMEPDRVARRIEEAILHRRRRVVIDWRYACLVAFWRLIPAWLWKRFPAFN